MLISLSNQGTVDDGGSVQLIINIFLSDQDEQTYFANVSNQMNVKSIK